MEKQKTTDSEGEEIGSNILKKDRVTIVQGEGRGGSGHDGQCQQSKKDARHSYHQGGHHNNYTNGHIFHPNSNPQFTDQQHPILVSRERSFVRPHSIHNNAYPQGGQPMEELHRQRSFHQGQTQQGRDLQQQFSPRGRKPSGGMTPNPRGKPAMEIYRPPTLRGPNGIENNGDISNMKYLNGAYADNNHYFRNKRPGLNIHAKEFVSVDQFEGLKHSKSSGNVHAHHAKHTRLQHSKSGHGINLGSEGGGGNQQSPSPPRVHFSDDKENINNDSKPVAVTRSSTLTNGPVPSPIKRSKSLGSADLCPPPINSVPLADIGPFSQDVQCSISKAINDPNALSARLLMEVVRHVFTRVIEASRYSEPTARICITIIEKETGETFLETLLNTCQEYFQQRNRLLRNSSTNNSHPSYMISHPKWIAYMSFLNEMYTQLKRRHVQLMTRRMKNSETAPGLLLLSLLAQCCQICLKEQAVNSLAETECLFFVLTAVGRDIEIEIPQQMARVMSEARDAFMTSVRVPAVKKTLLQLIEMHAARWQLPAPAVMYYYPGSGAK